MTGTERGQPTTVSRRIVNWRLDTSLGALVASAVYPLARFVTPPPVPEAPTDQVETGFVDDPALRADGFEIVRFGAEPVILVRVAADDFRAVSATCTHPRLHRQLPAGQGPDLELVPPWNLRPHRQEHRRAAAAAPDALRGPRRPRGRGAPAGGREGVSRKGRGER